MAVSGTSTVTGGARGDVRSLDSMTKSFDVVIVRHCLGTGRGDCRAPAADALCRPPGRTHSLLQPDSVDRLTRSSWRD